VEYTNVIADFAQRTLLNLDYIQGQERSGSQGCRMMAVAVVPTA